MKKLSRMRLLTFIERMHEVKVLVAGDFMVDKYVWGSVGRISPEAPVPVLVVDHEEYRPGGAGNVAANIGKLGGIPIALGLCGMDQAGKHLLAVLDERGIRVDGIVETEGRPTTLKCRVMAHGQQLVRMDTEATHEPDPTELDALISKANDLISEARAVVLQDYNKGTLGKELITSLIGMSNERGLPVAVDPKFHNFFAYERATLFKPNQTEVERALGIAIRDHEQLLQAGRRLHERIGVKLLLVTSGEHGMTLFGHEDIPQHIPSRAREVFDVSGAGDTVISVMTLALAAGASPLEASYLANAAAGVCVSKMGTQPVSREDLVLEIEDDEALG
jgi:rfaE bifunctional protein kinase chain/domain